jgi:hypothetical protein
MSNQIKEQECIGCQITRIAASAALSIYFIKLSNGGTIRSLTFFDKLLYRSIGSGFALVGIYSIYRINLNK